LEKKHGPTKTEKKDTLHQVDREKKPPRATSTWGEMATKKALLQKTSKGEKEVRKEGK